MKERRMIKGMSLLIVFSGFRIAGVLGLILSQH